MFACGLNAMHLGLHLLLLCARLQGAILAKLSVRSSGRCVCMRVRCELAEQHSRAHPWLQGEPSPSSAWGHCSCQVPAAVSLLQRQLLLLVQGYRGKHQMSV